MTAAAITVTAYFALSTEGGDYLTLDSATKGVLGSATYVLAGDTATDISRWVTGFDTSRGRDVNLNAIDVGQASVTLVNHDRRFDPTYAAGPYFGNIRPATRVAIAAAGITVIAGTIDDWNFTYDVSGDSRATLTCVDGLAAVAAAELAGFTGTAGQTTGARVESVLNRAEVGFGPNRSIDTGVSTLQADAVEAGTNALEYLQLVTRTELGYLFADRTGVLTFRDRHATVNVTEIVTFADTFAVGTVPFHAITASFGAELLYNRTVVSRVGGSTEEFIDTISADLYGMRTLPGTTDLLFDSDSQSYDMGLYLLGVYSDPAFRVSTVTLKVQALDVVQQATVLALDIADVVRVTWTPNGVGSPMDLSCVVEGVDHQASVDGEHLVVVRLGEADRRDAFVLDDSRLGVLNGPGLLTF